MWPFRRYSTTFKYSSPSGFKAFFIISIASSGVYLIFKLLSSGTPKSYKCGSSIFNILAFNFKYSWINGKLALTDLINELIIWLSIFSSNNTFSNTEL